MQREREASKTRGRRSNEILWTRLENSDIVFLDWHKKSVSILAITSSHARDP